MNVACKEVDQDRFKERDDQHAAGDYVQRAQAVVNDDLVENDLGEQWQGERQDLEAKAGKHDFAD